MALASIGSVISGIVGPLVVLGLIGLVGRAVLRRRRAREAGRAAILAQAGVGDLALPTRRGFDLGRGIAVAGFSFLLLPFLPLLVIGIVETTRGDRHTTLLPGAIGSALCLTAILATPWRHAIAGVVLHVVSPWRWRPLHQLIAVALLVAAAAATPFLIRQQRTSDRLDRIQRSHLQAALTVENDARARARTSADAVRLLAAAKARIGLAPTLSDAGSHTVSVAVAHAGAQIVLVVDSRGLCLALVDNRGAIDNGVRYAPSDAGTWHASWLPSGTAGCGAANLPKPSASGGIGLFHQDSWARGSFRP